MHTTGGSFAGALSWTLNPTAQVSYHFIVARDGAITQTVPIENTAWHAGTNNSGGSVDNRHSTIPAVRERRLNANSYSVGIEAVQSEIARRAKIHSARQVPQGQYPLTGMIKCGRCGVPYRRKHASAGSKYEKIVWICATYNTLGKAECASQQIPEDILMERIAEVGGLDMVEAIIVPDHFRLAFNMKNGRTVDAEWQHRSRRESWTAEMKTAAAEKAREHHGKNN